GFGDWRGDRRSAHRQNNLEIRQTIGSRSSVCLDGRGRYRRTACPSSRPGKAFRDVPDPGRATSPGDKPGPEGVGKFAPGNGSGVCQGRPRTRSGKGIQRAGRCQPRVVYGQKSVSECGGEDSQRSPAIMNPGADRDLFTAIALWNRTYL